MPSTQSQLAVQMQEIIAAHEADLRHLAAGDEAIVSFLLKSFTKLVAWRMRLSQDLSETQAAFVFGQESNGAPGRINEALAATTSDLLMTYLLPLFV